MWAENSRSEFIPPNIKNIFLFLPTPIIKLLTFRNLRLSKAIFNITICNNTHRSNSILFYAISHFEITNKIIIRGLNHMNFAVIFYKMRRQNQSTIYNFACIIEIINCLNWSYPSVGVVYFKGFNWTIHITAK